MPLNEQNQLAIISDILQNHQLECYGTVSECQQIQRVIQSLIAKQDINHPMKQTLYDIYEYGQQGKNTKDLEAHILTNQEQINHWLATLHDNQIT